MCGDFCFATFKKSFTGLIPEASACDAVTSRHAHTDEHLPKLFKLLLKLKNCNLNLYVEKLFHRTEE